MVSNVPHPCLPCPPVNWSPFPVNWSPNEQDHIVTFLFHLGSSYVSTWHFLGPRGPLREPSIPSSSSSLSVARKGFFFNQWFHYKSLHHHVRPIKSYIFWKLMTPTIHWRTEMTKTMTNTHIHKYTNVKSLKDPSCAIFLKSMEVKDIKYNIPM